MYYILLYISCNYNPFVVYFHRVHSQELLMPHNQTGLLLVFETVKEEDVGNYFCTATGKDGRGHSINIKLTVTSKLLQFYLHRPLNMV